MTLDLQSSRKRQRTDDESFLLSQDVIARIRGSSKNSQDKYKYQLYYVDYKLYAVQGFYTIVFRRLEDLAKNTCEQLITEKHSFQSFPDFNPFDQNERTNEENRLISIEARLACIFHQMKIIEDLANSILRVKPSYFDSFSQLHTGLRIGISLLNIKDTILLIEELRMAAISGDLKKIRFYPKFPEFWAL